MADDNSIDLTKLRAALTILAALDGAEYELRREAAAKEIGIPVSRLDKLVQQARRKPADQPGEGDGPGRKVIFPKEEPWPDEVDLAEVITTSAPV
jgi:hypothetical protein